jgi:RNA polymerase sigma factor (sigma-70 family)
MKMSRLFAPRKTNPIRTQLVAAKRHAKPEQTQFVAAQPSCPGEVLYEAGIAKPEQTQFKSEGRSEKWNLSHSSYDLYYRIMRKSRDQIYDELLVLKCQQGDSQAFNELVGRWQERLWRYALRLTGSDAAAWDIVQETWHGIIKGIRKLQDVAAFPQWAFRILNNKAADWRRKQHLQARLGEEITKQAQNNAEEHKGANERRYSLCAAIEKLPSDQRALLTLRYREDFDLTQIADILGVPEGTVKSRLHRTVEKLRQLTGQE